MRKVLAPVVFALIAMALACSSEVGFVVQFDGEPLRVWDGQQLLRVQTDNASQVPDLNTIVNISLSCKQYEDSSYEFYPACLSVPDDSSVWIVEVNGEADTRTFNFGESASIFMEWGPATVNLLDQTMTNFLLEDITEMNVTL